jgi:8-oxo-dGTP diphosphatase
MSRKNHQLIGGRLLQTDKRFSQLKEKQKEKINHWFYDEYKRIYDRLGKPPDSRHNDEILDAAYAKIEEAEIWIPYGEIQQYFYSRKNAFHKRYEKEKLRITEQEDLPSNE